MVAAPILNILIVINWFTVLLEILFWGLLSTINSYLMLFQGWIQDFQCGVGGAKTMITSAEPNLFLAGVQGPLKGPGSSRVVLMIFCAI